MSGGHFDYVQSSLRDALEQIGEDAEVSQRWPALAAWCSAMAVPLYELVREIDFDLSSDTNIQNDLEFERRAIGLIVDLALKAAPDEWFPRGKWATIQAVQGRTA